jgi:cation transport ATPase-like protein
MTLATPAQVVTSGLSSTEAAARLVAVGRNEVRTEDRFRLLRQSIAFASNPLVLILLVASPCWSNLCETWTYGFPPACRRRLEGGVAQGEHPVARANSARQSRGGTRHGLCHSPP